MQTGIEELGNFSPNQYGFSTGLSASRGQKSDDCSSDFAKAFHSVPHKQYSIRGDLLYWNIVFRW